MRQTLKTVLSNLSKKDTLFVFPSEIVAASWRQRVLRETEKKALRSDRFLSWDRFKEIAFTGGDEVKPVNSFHRLFFLYNLFEENRTGEPLFHFLINPDFRENSSRYINTFLFVLPQLKNLMGLMTGIEKAAEGRPFTGDCRVLWTKYTDFLRQHSLFEPNYLDSLFTGFSGKAFLFFPEIIQDLHLFLYDIRSAGNIEQISAGAEAGSPGLLFFDNCIQETGAVFNRIEQWLDEGSSPDDIALTSADPQLLPYVLEESKRRGLLLDERAGKSLSQYPGGRLFNLIREAVSADFNHHKLKNLLVNRRFPWKEERLWQGLLHFGAEQFCLQGGKEWEKNLRNYGEPSLFRAFQKLSRRLFSITGAKTVTELKKSIHAFRNDFFYDDKWQDEDLRVYQTCLTLLNELQEAENYLQIKSIPSPFSAFCEVLNSHIYVQPGAKRGIPLYPYRVSAGILPHRHAVIGISQSAVTTVVSPSPFLREDQKDFLGIYDKDYTGDFLNAYEYSGDDVYLSGSMEGAAGSQVAPPYFIAPETGPLLQPESRYHREKQFWRGTEPLPEKMYPLQKEGAEWIFLQAENFHEKKRQSGIIKDPGLNAEILSIQCENGLVHISPTRLEKHAGCAFSYLFSSVLKIDELTLTPSITDSRLEGSFYHRVLSSFFESLKNRGQVFSVEDLDQYFGEIQTIIIAQDDQWTKQGNMYLQPVHDNFLDNAERLLKVFIIREGETFPEYKTVGTEVSLAMEDAETGCLLKGRIDRISESPDEKILIVDYKKKNSVKQGDIAGESPVSFQMPFYMMLMDGTGRETEEIAYYSIEGERYIHVMNPEQKKAWFTKEQMEEASAVMNEAVQRMTEGVMKGEYPLTRNEDSCKYCSFRYVCRDKYAVRY